MFGGLLFHGHIHARKQQFRMAFVASQDIRRRVFPPMASQLKQHTIRLRRTILLDPPPNSTLLTPFYSRDYASPLHFRRPPCDRSSGSRTNRLLQRRRRYRLNSQSPRCQILTSDRQSSAMIWAVAMPNSSKPARKASPISLNLKRRNTIASTGMKATRSYSESVTMEQTATRA